MLVAIVKSAREQRRTQNFGDSEMGGGGGGGGGVKEIYHIMKQIF